MNQPLGNYVGNWLEVYESIHVLRGEIKNDLSELSIKLAGAMIYLGKKQNQFRTEKKLPVKKLKMAKHLKSSWR